jgi:aminoglycoside phosphotransferase (APT) family kinase protein
MASDTLTRMRLDPDSLSDVDRPVFDWLTRHFGRAPTNFYRQLRWRIGWEADIELDGETRTVLVRGSRGEDYLGPMTMHQEAGVHHIMERHAVPAPRVYGMIEDPLAIVMERMPGGINSELAGPDAVKWKIRSEFIQALVKLHAIPVEQFGALGLPVPRTPRDIAFNLYGQCIAIARDKMKNRPFGLVEFFARWLERNAPADRTRAAYVTGDAGQFLYDGDRFVGLIDFEVSYIGDPAAEFSGMRVRDTTEPLGDVSKLCDLYESLTGDQISKRTIEYHSADFSCTNSMLMWHMMFEPEVKNDYIAYLQFSVATSRWGLCAIAEADGITLEAVADPIRNPISFEAAAPLLVQQLANWNTDDGGLRHHLDSASVPATYLQRCLEYGASVLEADLADTVALTGRSVSTRAEADAAVDEFVRQADDTHDAALTQFFHRWLQRQNFLLEGCGSQAYLTATNLQYIPPRPVDLRH